MKAYFSEPSEKLLNEFNTSMQGLKSSAINDLRAKYGSNQLSQEKKQSVMSVFLSQFKDFLVIILIIASIISFISGNKESTVVILFVIILNAILGTIQHFKAEKSIESLKNLSAPRSKVKRDGIKVEINSQDIVPGDIVIVEAGDIVPADGRIIESSSLRVNESSLTGESESVDKTSKVIDAKELPLADQKNMVFSGSLVNFGTGTILITSIGMNTEIGKIASLLDSTKQKETPLQKSLDSFGKKLGIGIIILCILIFLMNIYHKVKILDSLMFAVALAVAAIPEALSSIVTIVLAIGTQRLSKENAIIKTLKSVESLGSVSVICSDKTGTLTQNKMTVQKIYINEKIIDADKVDLNEHGMDILFKNCILCNDATLDVGDPTEIAFISFGSKYDLTHSAMNKSYPRIDDVPFDSDRKLMSTLHSINGKTIMFTKGAFESLHPRLTNININGQIRPITDDDLASIVLTNDSFAKEGLRVLTFAYRELEAPKVITTEDEKNYTFIGLIASQDPPRPESKQAVGTCIDAGIKPCMITGDNITTATTIAKKIGIFQDGDNSLQGVDLEKISDEKLKTLVEHTSVYARVSPEHKIRIVKAWQSLGKICAMTGDGVNDAPALKMADIGIAMGITGTEVSKDAADMILADDNFSTIIKAVTTGRNIYSNIKNSIRFLLSGNMAAIISVLYSSFAGLPVIFAPVHLLFINLLTDSLPAIAIGMEPQHDDVLKDKPRDPKEPILTTKLISRILMEGFLFAIFILIGFYIGLKNGNALKGSTMAFSILCLARLFHGFNCRGNYTVFGLGFFKNIPSIIAFLIGFILLNLVLLVPPLRRIFQVSPITTGELLLIYILAFIPTIIIQITKFMKYKK